KNERVALARRQDRFGEHLETPFADRRTVLAVVNIIRNYQRGPDAVNVRAGDSFVEADEVENIMLGVDEIGRPALRGASARALHLTQFRVIARDVFLSDESLDRKRVAAHFGFCS